MDCLGDFSFRSAVPFGYLITLIGLLAVSAAGLRLLLRGLAARPIDRARAIVGSVILAMVAVSVAANLVYSASLELNPAVTAASLTGEWRQDGSRLSLYPDGTYRCQGYSECNPFGAEGRWRVELDGLLFERLDGRYAAQNVVRYFGTLRLTDPIGDFDSWEGRLTFEHVDPPSR